MPPFGFNSTPDTPAYGFVRVAAASPRLSLADPKTNAARTIEAIEAAARDRIDIIAFPELNLTGYTCHDLFFQKTLLDGAMEALERCVRSTRGLSPVAVVGMPLVVDDQIFNVAVAMQNGAILGVVPKTYLPNYKEFYDARYFAPPSTASSKSVRLMNLPIPFGTDLLFDCPKLSGCVMGIEICEDLWGPIPPSALQAIHGATVLVNLSASNETIAKAAYRRQLVANQSATCLAAYVYAAAGIGESSTDLVFGGHSLIAENGQVVAEAERFRAECQTIATEIDLDHIRLNRLQTTSFADAILQAGIAREYRRIPMAIAPTIGKLSRPVDPHPFVPSEASLLRERCEEIFAIQRVGLTHRLSILPVPISPAIGVSGGLDSTLSLLVLCRSLDSMGVPRSRIRALTMPGFGTTSRTRTNALKLMEQLGISWKEIDIREMCLLEMKALGHSPFGILLDGLDVETLQERLLDVPSDERHDLTFENIQARMRTTLLMNSGFVVGTGDLSELALGWCTYNADHMSMYNPNVSVPKTLVKFLTRWAAENEFDGDVRATLLDIVATEISPELLPMGRDGKAQSTEDSVGPYELNDFFIYHFLRYATPPEKILWLASQANFDVAYPLETVHHWLELFIRRFFIAQFKRTCLPDGPKVGSVSLSPRGDWRMPTDAVARLWLDAAENAKIV